MKHYVKVREEKITHKVRVEDHDGKLIGVPTGDTNVVETSKSVLIKVTCDMCSKECPKGSWQTTAKVYEGHFSANRTNSDITWHADLCPECQSEVYDFINQRAKDNAARGIGRTSGVSHTYSDPMGG